MHGSHPLTCGRRADLRCQSRAHRFVLARIGKGRRMCCPSPFPRHPLALRFAAAQRTAVNAGARRPRAWNARCSVTVISRCRFHQKGTCIIGSKAIPAARCGRGVERQRREWAELATMKTHYPPPLGFDDVHQIARQAGAVPTHFLNKS